MRRGESFAFATLATLVLLLLALLMQVGCSETPEGPTTYVANGKVITTTGDWKGGNGTVEFRSLDGSFQGVAMGQIQPDGSFELGTSSSHGRSPGAVVGQHRVTITMSDPRDPQMVRSIPLAEPVTVEANDNNYFELTLPE